MKTPFPSASSARLCALAQANVTFEGDVIQAVAEQGDMTISDAQALVDFGSFVYVQAHSKGCCAEQIAGLLLADTRSC